jgi:hypothetical protein
LEKKMKRITVMTFLFVAIVAATAQQPPANAVDPNAPALTLDEKITLGTDDITRGDLIEKLQKQYLKEVEPVNKHQEAAKAVIEKDHPGWTLVNSPGQGWHFEKAPKPQGKPAEAPKK